MLDSKNCQIVSRDSDHVVVGKECELYEYCISSDTWSALCDHEIPVSNFALTVYQS